MILISSIVNKPIQDLVARYQNWIEEVFVADNDVDGITEMVKAVRNNNPKAFILLLTTDTNAAGLPEIPCNDIFAYSVETEKDLESRILYQGSPAVHRLVDSYRTQLEESKANIQSETDTAWQLGEINSLKERLGEKDGEIEVRDKRIDTLEDEIDRLNAEISNMTLDQKASETQMGAKQVEDDKRHAAELEALNNKIDELVGEHARETSHLKGVLDARNNTITELNEMIAAANAEITVLKKSKPAAVDTSSAGDVEALQKQYMDAQKELVTLRGKVDGLESEIAGNAVTIESLTTQQELYKEEVKAANAKADASKKALEDVQNSISSSSDEITRLRAENVSLEQRLVMATATQVSTSESKMRELTLGLANYTGKAVLVGVCGYGSSYFTANVAVATANTLGSASNVAIIDLDPTYSSMNTFYNKSRNTAVVRDAQGEERACPYVTALNYSPQYERGLTLVRENKSGSVRYGGGCLGGIYNLDVERFVNELKGLASTMEYIILNFGCLSLDLYQVINEVALYGRLICVTDGSIMPVRYMAGQLKACKLAPRDASWVLVSDTPIVDPKVQELMTGVTSIMIGEQRISSRTVSIENGQFQNTFMNFIMLVTQ